GHEPLARELRRAVGVDGPGFLVLADDARGRLAVDGCGRGEDEALHALLAQGREEGLEGLDVLLVVELGPRDGLAHLLLRREVHDALDGVLADHLAQALEGALTREVELDEGHLTDPARTSSREIVDDDDVPAGLLERANDICPDVPGAAGDQDAHRWKSTRPEGTAPARQSSRMRT